MFIENFGMMDLRPTSTPTIGRAHELLVSSYRIIISEEMNKTRPVSFGDVTIRCWMFTPRERAVVR